MMLRNKAYSNRDIGFALLLMPIAPSGFIRKPREIYIGFTCVSFQPRLRKELKKILLGNQKALHTTNIYIAPLPFTQLHGKLFMFTTDEIQQKTRGLFPNAICMTALL